MFRKFFIWLVKSVIVIVLTSLLFSMFSWNLPSLVEGMFDDIYSHSSPESKQQITNQLSKFCSQLEGADTSLIQQEMAKKGMQANMSKIDGMCNDYRSGNISGSNLFSSFIGASIPDKFELPKEMPFEKYNKAISFANQNKMIYIAILLVLAVLLYFLAGSLGAFMIILTEMSLSLGLLILMPYLLIMAYTKFVAIDTTPLMTSILSGNSGLDIKALANLILLMVLRTYTTSMLALGAVFLALGIAGKIYARRLRKKEEEPVKSKKSEDEELEEELDKKSKEKEKSVKEVLDELEETQKKKKS